MPTPQHFINGEFVAARSGGTFEVVDPATEQLTTMAARGDAQDIEAAVKAAKDAFDGGAWSRAKPSFRRKVLFKAADLIEARSDEIIKLQSLEMGGPIGPAHPGPHPMIERSAWNFRFFAEEQELAGNESFNRDDSLLTYTMRDRGRRVRPDHAVERTVHAVDVEDGAVSRVRQFAPCTSRRSCRRCRCACCARFSRKPACRAGVYNMVLGYGAEAGVPLVEHKDVVGVSFTGSVPTARDIAARAAKQLKRTSFELGGKSANIIFADANLATRGAGRGDVDLHEFGPGVRRRLAHPRAAADLSAVSRRVRESGGGLERRAIRSIARRASVRSCTSASTIA